MLSEIIEPAPAEPAPSTLAENERIIDNALIRMAESWHEIGAALARINEGRLYRDYCGTFAEYVEQRYPALSRSTAYEWMEAAPVVKAIEEHNSSNPERIIEPPAKIAHARALSRLPPMAQPIALEKARESALENGRNEPTIYEIRVAVANILEEPEPAPESEIKRERAQRALSAHIIRLWEELDRDNQLETLGILKTSIKGE